MEGLPQVVETRKVPLDIEIPPSCRDHRFQGRSVLPAVVAMESLARSTVSQYEDVEIFSMTRASFDRFLYLDSGQRRVQAFNQIECLDNGGVRATLLTRGPAPKAPITRTKAHVTLTFSETEGRPPRLPLDLAAAVEGICTAVEPEVIYRDLVPFGPGYRNIVSSLWLSPDGALAEIGSPKLGETHPEWFLGSPYLLDAAFHAACVWGQRFAGFVGFPVSFKRRVILHRTHPEHTYFCRVIPVQREKGAIAVDIYIYGHDGRLFELAEKVGMQDVGSGRWVPPVSIAAVDGESQPTNLKHRCPFVAVVELDGMAPFAARALSPAEEERSKRMGKKRKQSFLAARLAMKYLYRRLSSNDRQTAPEAITTIFPETAKPSCPGFDGIRFFSVAHDNRFAIAVSSEERIGVDVEQISERVLKSCALFMDASERERVYRSSLGEVGAALRVWSAKEVVTKALDISLADAWYRVVVTDIGEGKSEITIRGKGPERVFHDTVAGHLFTLLQTRLERDH